MKKHNTLNFVTVITFEPQQLEVTYLQPNWTKRK